ncbi:GMC family oxidoreductase [Sphingosinicellaceae bacterium]|nr:GMC family oxidoreductase [Sphingosinicellaceae bacterium]
MIERPDYVVVGSGAGGGTLAARLAERGATVVVLEAGGDPRSTPEARDDYDVPGFHAKASENAVTAWNFRVAHYANPERAARDPKCGARGVLYPRAGTLGGCTAHNAMIIMPPPPGDWDAVAELTGDPSWSGANMRKYWQRIEACHHRPVRRWLARLTGRDASAHGWRGWLGVETAMPADVLRDRTMMGTMLVSAMAAVGRRRGWLMRLLTGKGDPNDARMAGQEGVWTVPLSTTGHARQGTRERLLEVQRRHPERLHIELDALATRIMLDAEGRAVGIEYLKGARLYGATPGASTAASTPCRVIAGKEVILCGGSFNSPQLLMLSGIGPADELARHGIPVVVDSPGVGANLQDRYEVGIVSKMVMPWAALAAACYERGDPVFRRWARHEREGLYTSNGVALGVSRRSAGTTGPDADLWLMALVARFEGYATGYSRVIGQFDDCLTWAILKGRTRNRAGTVRLASLDPKAPPVIDFAYFADGDFDLKAVAEAVGIAREIAAAGHRAGLIEAELSPGADVTGAALERWIADHAWGHHACGTAAIGTVLDTDFRVCGVPRLRVVDASVFPRIPGFFISAAIMMVAEKAADAILGEP